MSTRYEHDIVAWAREQAELLRSRRFTDLDIEHLAEEIEDVGKSEQRELASRIAVLSAHLLKWQYQPEKRGKSWEITIRNQRKNVSDNLEETPSLKVLLDSPAWLERVWRDAIALAEKETGIGADRFPELCPWRVDQILDFDFLP